MYQNDEEELFKLDQNVLLQSAYGKQLIVISVGADVLNKLAHMKMNYQKV